MSMQSQSNFDLQEGIEPDTDRVIMTSTRLEQLKQQLQLTLRRGLAIIKGAWAYRTQDWATSICATDLDGDGDTEVIVGTYDGRILVLTKWGTPKWEQVLGDGKWVCTVAGVQRLGEETIVVPNEEKRVCIVAGSRNGNVYALTQAVKSSGSTIQALLCGKFTATVSVLMRSLSALMTAT